MRLQLQNFEEVALYLQCCIIITTYRNVSLSMQLFTGTNIVVAVALAYIAIAAQQVIPCTIVWYINVMSVMSMNG